MGILPKGRPPKTLSQEINSVTHSRMEAQPGIVSTLQDLGMSRWTTIRDLDLPLGIPSELPDYAVPRQDASHILRMVFCLELPEKGIRFPSLGPGMVGQHEIKVNEEKGPSRLPGVEPFGPMDVMQIFMVGPDKEGLL